MENTMPPKVKITKEKIIQTATELVRQSGEQAINARSIAMALGCSTQPVFSNFPTMEDLKQAVIASAFAICNDYLEREKTSGLYPPYKASGMAYIRFAKEEKELFKLLYMRDRSEDAIRKEDILFDQMTEMAQQNIDLNYDKAKRFHLEVWAFVHGIATMFATQYVDLDWELVSTMVTDAYQGLKKQYKGEMI